MNNIHITLGNSKLGGFIPQLNLPPIKTCRDNAPCCKLCYACKGRFCYKNVIQSHEDNLNAFNTDNKAFFDYIIDYLNNGLIVYKYFRWHSTGDIVNADYFLGMIRVAKECKNTNFLAFTKKFELVNDYIKNGGEIPKNLHIVYSAWDKSFKVDNPYNLPITYVDFKDTTQNANIPPTAIPCNGKCYECLGCWQLQNGQSVVFKQH